jgi:inward rectifier potassium channel
MDKNNFMNTPVKRSSTSLFSNAFIDFYHLVVQMTWPRFLASFAIVFLAINLFLVFYIVFKATPLAGLKVLGF